METHKIIAAIIVLVLYLVVSDISSASFELHQNSQSIPSLRSKYSNSTTLVRDNELKDLVVLLNSGSDFFSAWARSNLTDNAEFSAYFSTFLRILEPWIIGDPPVPIMLKDNQTSNSTMLNCGNPRYQTVFTGSRLSNPRAIIDFIPFGYDIDKLEIRLIENFDIIDAFVIFESSLTQTGTSKSQLFGKIRKSERFSVFKSKIIYLSANTSDLQARLSSGWSWHGENWELENLMRSEMVRLFQELSPEHEQYSLKERIMAAVETPLGQLRECSLAPFLGLPEFKGRNRAERVWNELRACAYSSQQDQLAPIPLGIQNDGDEMATGDTLQHLKNCVLMDPLVPIMVPMLSYKRSVELLHEEGCITLPRMSPSSLCRFSRSLSMSPLSKFLATNSTHRDVMSHVHMNVGAGIHLSSIAEPGEYWFKSIGTQHGMQNLEMRSAMPLKMIEAGSKSEISVTMVGRVSRMNEACRTDNPRLVSRSMFTEEEQDFIFNSLPWALQHNPRRYPFIIPNCKRTMETLEFS